MSEIISEQPLIFSIEEQFLENRRDVTYYHPNYLEVEEILRNSPYDLKRLGDKDVTFQITDGHHGSPEYVDDGVPYLRVVNINGLEIVLDDLKFISKEQSKRIGKRCHLKAGEVILSIVGTVGKVAVVTKQFEGYSYSRDLARIIPRRNINPFYIAAFLYSKFGQSQLERKTTGAVQKGLYLNSVKSIKIPVPPVDVQEQIARIMLSSIQEEKRNIEKANDLVIQANNFISHELGLKSLEIEKKSMFWVDSEDLQDRREPRFYSPKFARTFKSLENGKYELVTLRDISKPIASGATPKAKGEAYTSKTDGIPFIRSGDLAEDNVINYDNVLYIKNKIHNTMLKRSRLGKNDILIAIVGATIGKVAIFLDEREANINQAIALVRIKNQKKIDPFYVTYFLRNKFGQFQLDRLKRPVARANINCTEIGLLRIPLPPLDIQRKIVETMNKALQLKRKLYKDTDHLRENTKSKFEKIISGK